MVAGKLSRSGFYMGDDMYAPRESNPKGFFESRTINWINEDLLAQVAPARPPVLGRWWFRDRPLPRQRWLARVPVGIEVPCRPGVATRIQAQVARTPFCFKDPRFSYTLPAWRPFLQDTVFVCVFRDPMVTAASILKECATARYLRTLKISVEIAVEIWVLMYEHVLQAHRKQGEWLFLHYDQVLQGESVDRLEDVVGASVDREFPNPAFRRSLARDPMPAPAQQTYRALCVLAGYTSE
jgi:hypothetical protein